MDKVKPQIEALLKGAKAAGAAAREALDDCPDSAADEVKYFEACVKLLKDKYLSIALNSFKTS